MRPGLFSSSLRIAFAEERVANAPQRVWRDWALIAIGLVTAVVELVLRDDLGWPVLSFIVCVGLMPTLLWRRQHPVAMLAMCFGAFSALSIAGEIAGTTAVPGLFTGSYVLVIAYAVFRWGAGRDFPLAFALMAAVVVVNIITDYTGIGEVIGGIIVLLVPVQFGALVRYRHASEERRVDEIRLREREQLARELHDTVAHHVSAIAVQAQAGMVASQSDPARRALAAIEEEASRTLTELRLMVSALRDTDDADVAPQRSLADIDELARIGSGSPTVDIELVGELDHLRPAVEAAVYRLAQESITNAIRHARDATSVLVRVVGLKDAVELTVRDNGATPSPANGSSGYGLTGMSERARLLGGTLDAGPAHGGGWLVSASIPTS